MERNNSFKFKLHSKELSAFEIGYMSISDVIKKDIDLFLMSVEEKMKSSPYHGDDRLLQAVRSDSNPIVMKVYLACVNSSVYYFILMGKNKKYRDHKLTIHEQFYLGVTKGLKELLGQIKALENNAEEFNHYLNSSLGLYVTNSRRYAEFVLDKNDIYSSPFMTIILGMYKYYEMDIRENIQERDKIESVFFSESTWLMEDLSDNFIEI